MCTSSLILPSVTGTGSMRTYNSQDVCMMSVLIDWQLLVPHPHN